MTRVKEFLAAGVNIAFAQDNILDPFNENFGDGDPLKNGFLAAYAAQLGSKEELEILFDMATIGAAKLLRLSHYGMEEGCRGDLVVTPVESARDAFRLQPPRRYVIRKGRVIAESEVNRKFAWESAGAPAGLFGGVKVASGGRA